jgi:hypothetical protein
MNVFFLKLAARITRIKFLGRLARIAYAALVLPELKAHYLGQLNKDESIHPDNYKPDVLPALSKLNQEVISLDAKFSSLANSAPASLRLLRRDLDLLLANQNELGLRLRLIEEKFLEKAISNSSEPK